MRRTRVAPDRPVPGLTHRGPSHAAGQRSLCRSRHLQEEDLLALPRGRHGEVRFLGDVDHTPEAVQRLVTKLAGKFGRLPFCYEAGPTGHAFRLTSTPP